MYVPLCVKTEYSLLNSLIKTTELIDFLTINNYKTCAICDTNLYGVMDFYTKCRKNDIKPIIALDVLFNDKHLYLYAMNYSGYQNLLKINTIIQKRNLSLADLELYKSNILVIIPFVDSEIYDDFTHIFEEIYIGYSNEYEKNSAFIITKNLVYLKKILALSLEDSRYLDYLLLIENGITIDELEKGDYSKNYFTDELLSEEDIATTIKIANKLNLEIPYGESYMPIFDKTKDSNAYLVTLAKKGLEKRLHGKINEEYSKRLQYELNVISNTGYIDYFLIVYDYVKFAKVNNILVGPGRGSAAGSLVSYSLGITNIDPIKYDLLFERFLNPERISMPDIDIDFEYTKRDDVISYIKTRYGQESVSPIMTFGTLASKQVIRDVGKILNIEPATIDALSKLLDSKLDLKANMKINAVKRFVTQNPETKEVFKIALKLEGLKRHISTHAAGVVIASRPLDSIIPIVKNNEMILTGVTMEYLEDLGLLKMDLLALKNLTIIANVLELIKNNTNNDLNLNDIPLDDTKTIELFKKADTVGIFQYESSGMKNFLSKLKANSFNDLIAAVALFRPGPMQNIDLFIQRKEGKIKINYLDDSLESILQDTYGVIVYQEQIMEILKTMAGYTYAEADNIRRAMSKKKLDVMEQEKNRFVEKSMNLGYSKEVATNIYDLILKFANYGFNKAHSVSYALIGYQMAYLKTNYPTYFIANLLNMSLDSVIKTKEYLDEAKKNNIKFTKPNINSSNLKYQVSEDTLQLPLSVIKNVGHQASLAIIEERKNGEYIDFFNFVARTYGKSITRLTLEMLIDADAFRCFDINHATMHASLDNAINYAELAADLDLSLIIKPAISFENEFDDYILMQKEMASYGFYVTNHPSSKYNGDKIIKIENIKNYFDKRVEFVVLIGSIKKIKTKKNEDMAFLTCSDETSTTDFTVFANIFSSIENINKGDLVNIIGHVTKRFDKYQVNIHRIEKINNEN